MIERVEIDCDEGGFHLILHGEIEVEPSRVEDDEGVLVIRSPVNLRLSPLAALQLRAEVREKVEEWAATHDEVRADFERYRRTGDVPPYVRTFPVEQALEIHREVDRRRDAEGPLPCERREP